MNIGEELMPLIGRPEIGRCHTKIVFPGHSAPSQQRNRHATISLLKGSVFARHINGFIELCAVKADRNVFAQPVVKPENDIGYALSSPKSLGDRTFPENREGKAMGNKIFEEATMNGAGGGKIYQSVGKVSPALARPLRRTSRAWRGAEIPGTSGAAL